MCTPAETVCLELSVISWKDIHEVTCASDRRRCSTCRHTGWTLSLLWRMMCHSLSMVWRIFRRKVIWLQRFNMFLFCSLSVKPLTARHIRRQRRNSGLCSQATSESGYSSAKRSIMGGNGSFMYLICVILKRLCLWLTLFLSFCTFRLMVQRNLHTGSFTSHIAMETTMTASERSEITQRTQRICV